MMVQHLHQDKKDLKAILEEQAALDQVVHQETLDRQVLKVKRASVQLTVPATVEYFSKMEQAKEEEVVLHLRLQVVAVVLHLRLQLRMVGVVALHH